MDWLTDTPFLTRERGFYSVWGLLIGFYTDPYNNC